MTDGPLVLLEGCLLVGAGCITEALATSVMVQPLQLLLLILRLRSVEPVPAKCRTARKLKPAVMLVLLCTGLQPVPDPDKAGQR